MKKCILLSHLFKSYNHHRVISDLNLEVYEGETLAILGRSGVGKSVLLRLIMGIEKPDRGSIEINGVNTVPLKHQALYSALQEMGMLFQASALFDSMNVRDNTAFYLIEHLDPLTQRRLKADEIQERVKEALDLVGMKGSEDKMPSELSGGMRKRVALARLIVYRPKILLYDEPTTGLDPITAHQINALILRIQKELKATSLVVTHDMSVAMTVADRIALNDEGKILYIAKKEEFVKHEDPKIREFYQQCPSD